VEQAFTDFAGTRAFRPSNCASCRSFRITLPKTVVSRSIAFTNRPSPPFTPKAWTAFLRTPEISISSWPSWLSSSRARRYRRHRHRPGGKQAQADVTDPHSHQLPLPDLSAFEGKRVEVIVVEEELQRADTPLPSKEPRPLGSMRGQIAIPEDFDAPLPPEIQRYFDGEEDT